MISLPETKGARVVKFIEKFCVHGEGDFFGEPFKLDQWQQAIIYEMYEIKDNGERKYREALIGLPKGNGKTALAAAIGLVRTLRKWRYKSVSGSCCCKLRTSKPSVWNYENYVRRKYIFT